MFCFDLQIVTVTFQDNRTKPKPPGSEVQTEKKRMPSGVTMVIVIAAVGGVCCVALVILQVVVKFLTRDHFCLRPITIS